MTKTKGFSERDINTCLKAGWLKVWKEDSRQGEMLCARFVDDEHLDKELQMVRDEDGICAHVLEGQSRLMSTPRSITVESGEGYSPRRRFKSVKQTAECALNNRLY